MADIRTDWADNIGMVEDAAYLNAVGAALNANTHARVLWGARSAMPAASAANQGGTYRCTDCAAEYYSDGATWTKVRLNGAYSPGMADPPTSGLTSYGSGGTFSTAGDARLFSTTGNGGVFSGEYKALSPTSNYTVRGYLETAVVLAQAVPGIRLGIGIFDGTGKAISWGMSNSPAMLVARWSASNNPTDAYSQGLTSSSVISMPNWFQIRDDGTNLNFEYSHNGNDWIWAYSETRTSFLTAAYVGWGVYWNVTAGSARTLKARLRSLSTSTP